MVIRKLNEVAEHYQKLQGNYDELSGNYIDMKKKQKLSTRSKRK